MNKQPFQKNDLIRGNFISPPWDKNAFVYGIVLEIERAPSELFLWSMKVLWCDTGSTHWSAYDVNDKIDREKYQFVASAKI